jgi:hypothetical protein
MSCRWCPTEVVLQDTVQFARDYYNYMLKFRGLVSNS